MPIVLLTCVVGSKIQCLLLALILSLIGGSFGYGLSLILRMELTLPGFILCPPPQYNPIITFHGLASSIAGIAYSIGLFILMKCIKE